MVDREKKRGKQKYKKLNISRTKELFRWNKKLFIVFEGKFVKNKKFGEK